MDRLGVDNIRASVHALGADGMNVDKAVAKLRRFHAT